ncbi:MAG: Ig-like domain-containing protein, partial [Daejeonella sp.]|nr:Ig-like domain-containing protein [Daejeonella sp.]
QWNGSDGTDYALTSKNVNVTITAVNTPPVAVADNYSTTKGGTLTVAAPGVLTNDSDADANQITAIRVTSPSNGTLTLNANGSFTYIHNNGASASDSFTYKVNDGTADGNTVTVSITVVNNPPVVSNIVKTGTGPLPIPFTVADFTTKYTDPNGDPLVKVKIATLPSNGVLKLNGVPVIINQEIPVADLGGLTFEPALNFTGTINFAWNGSDGTSYALNNANVGITIAPPTDPNAKIGLAKNLASATPVLNGTYDVKFVFTAVNFGPNGLENISIKDNLALAFGGSEVIIKSITAFGNLRANTLFNGSTDTELLLPASRLLAAEEAKIELLINVRLVTTSGVFQNTATAEASSSVNGFKVRDVSTNGLRPDPNTAADVSPAET